jgi:hypothetical protein
MGARITPKVKLSVPNVAADMIASAIVIRRTARSVAVASGALAT